MSSDAADWLHTGRGLRPRLRWSFAGDAPVVDVRLARETGEVLIADSSGGVYLLDRQGNVLTLTRVPSSVKAVAWCDTGTAGAVLLSPTRLGWLNRRLAVQWTMDLPDAANTVAIDPYGYHVAVSLADGLNLVYNADKKQVCRFETVRPVRHVQFLATEPGLIVAAEYGLLAEYDLDGDPLWSEKLWSNVGDLATTGDGRSIYLAGFAHGVQVFDGTGDGRGSYLLEGIANHVAVSFSPRRILASTIERHLYALDGHGELVWAVQAPDDIAHIACSPLGDWYLCGFAGGRIVRLDAREDR